MDSYLMSACYKSNWNHTRMDLFFICAMFTRKPERLFANDPLLSLLRCLVKHKSRLKNLKKKKFQIKLRFYLRGDVIPWMKK